MLIGISSCIYLPPRHVGSEYNGKEKFYILTSTYGLVECPPFTTPLLPAVPSIPDIPESVVGNHDAIENILIAKIKEHRQYEEMVKEMMMNAFADYVKRCIK